MLPSVMGDHKEAVDHSKRERWYGEEVHRSNRFSVVAQKRRPPFCWLWVPGCLPHATQHGSLRDVEAEHLQFAMDARRAPGSVLGYHAEDELAQFSAE
jgi:hypothetical protein